MGEVCLPVWVQTSWISHSKLAHSVIFNVIFNLGFCPCVLIRDWLGISCWWDKPLFRRSSVEILGCLWPSFIPARLEQIMFVISLFVMALNFHF